DHTRLRRLIHASFTARRVAEMRPMVERISTSLLDDLTGRDTFDLVRDFAFPLPMQIICELLGFPAEERDAYRAWSTAVLTHGDDPGDFERAIEAMTEYIAEQVDRRRARPGDDILTE